MKLHRLAVISGLILLAFQGLVVAQKSAGGSDLIKASITLDSERLVQQKPAIVTITLENISGREVDLKLIGSLELLSLNKDALARKHQVMGDSYWSPIDVSSGTPLSLKIIDPELQKKGVVVGRVPKATFRFGKDETKTFKVDLTKTQWNASMSSMWPDQSLFEAVPTGSYSLLFRFENGKNQLKSNPINVLVE